MRDCGLPRFHRRSTAASTTTAMGPPHWRRRTAPPVIPQCTRRISTSLGSEYPLAELVEGPTCEDGPVIILAATPIGNLGDASPRLVEALSTATVIAAEDTRVTVHLMRALGIENRPRLIPLHEHNEADKAAEIIELAREAYVVVPSDAGMPAISDPGFALVSRAAAAGVTVIAIPGPSAVLTALALSGLATDRFCFEGFLPRKSGDRRRALTELRSEKRTMVFFESPHRLAASLTDIADVFGAERRLAIARELTKLYEEVRRGTVSELVGWAAAGVKGELVV